MERELPKLEIAEIAEKVYSVFEWRDDYLKAQDEKTVLLRGKRYRRIRYGREPIPKDASGDFAAAWEEIITRPCHDCGVIRGELHLDGCDMESCPRCKGQYLGCGCAIEEGDLRSANVQTNGLMSTE